MKPLRNQPVCRNARRTGRSLPALLLAVLQLVGLAPAVAQSPDSGGRAVVLGDRAFWLSCAGKGKPSVLLEAGHNESSASWEQVQPAVAAVTRVCSYDRTGLGRSGPGFTRSRRGREVVEDLHALLQAAGEPGPWILAGHSLGGALVRLYANAYPEQVAALVLIDAVHQDEFARLDELLTPKQRAAGRGMRPMSPEGLDIEAVLAEVRSIRAPLRVPLVVLARGRPLAEDEMPPDWNTEQRRRREALRRALQTELSRLSPAGELVVADRSGHFIQRDQPDLVAGVIGRLVAQWRREHRP